jgi:Zn-dependent peptidase ImmA (M78 family)
MSPRTGAMFNPSQTDPDERYASDFAAVLLMPESAFRKVWAEKDGSVVVVGYVFGVPPEAVQYRLHMLGLA